jgi:hypothetical protein
MVEMANPVYFDFVGKVEPPYILSPTQNLNLDTTYTIEETFMEQKQVRAQLQSPTQQYERQRHDSLFSYTPSIDSKPGDPSPHQAGIQPCFPAAQMTSEDYPLRPTNMSRSNSQYATFTNRPQRHCQNRLSFGNGTANSAVAMSRSSTHHSIMSAGYQEQRAAPQPRAQLDPTGCDTPSFRYTVPITSTNHLRRESRLGTEIGPSLSYDYRTPSASTTEPGDLSGMLSYTDRGYETWGRSLSGNE